MGKGKGNINRGSTDLSVGMNGPVAESRGKSIASSVRFLNESRHNRTYLDECKAYAGVLIQISIFCALAPIFGLGWIILPFTHGMWAVVAFLATYIFTQSLPPYYSAWWRNGPLNRPIVQALEDYLPECNIIKEADLDPSHSYIFAWHPHGRLFYGFGMLVGLFHKWFPEIDRAGKTMFGGVNDMMFRIPILGNWLHLCGLVECNKHKITAILSKGNSVGLIVGGIEEVLEGTFEDKDVLFLKNRKGFIKIAADYDSGVVPIFCFGENCLYQHDSPAMLSFWRLMNKLGRFGAPFPILGRWGTPIPKRVPMLIVIGKPLFAEKGESINDFHSRYVRELEKLHDKYVGISSYPKRKLVIV